MGTYAPRTCTVLIAQHQGFIAGRYFFLSILTVLLILRDEIQTRILMLSEELGEFFHAREESLQYSKSSMNADLVPSLIAKLYLDLSGVDAIGLSLTKVRNCRSIFLKFTSFQSF
jgi:hypothetical protein